MIVCVRDDELVSKYGSCFFPTETGMSATAGFSLSDRDACYMQLLEAYGTVRNDQFQLSTFN